MTEEFINRTGLVGFPEVYLTPTISPVSEDEPIDAVTSGDTLVESTIS